MIDLIAMSGFSAQGANGLLQFLPFALILGIFYFMILLPMKRRQKKVQEFQAALKVGDRVITTSGIHGQVTRLSDASVQIQIADKVRVEMTLTSPACPAGPQIVSQAKVAIEKLDGVKEAEIKLVLSPPWSPDRMTDEARDQLGIF